MNDHDALLRAIQDAPDDDAPRLVHADWLEEHGQPQRAEFIRLQCELSQLAEDDPRAAALHKRESALYAEHGAGWKAELPRLPGVEWGDWPPFVRGFVGHVRFRNFSAFAAHAATVFRLLPDPTVRFRVIKRCHRLAGCAELAHVRRLDLTGRGIGDAGVRALAESEYAAGLWSLDLHYNNVGPHGVRALAESRHLRHLRTLSLAVNAFGPEGLEALTASPVLATVHTLNLTGNNLGPRGMFLLARSPHLGELRSLYLVGNRIGDEGAQALIDSPGLKNLRRVRLADPSVGERTRQALRTRFPGAQV